MRRTTILIGTAALALSACDRVEWHLGQEREEEPPATAESLDDLAQAVEELDALDGGETPAEPEVVQEPVIVDLGISGEGVLAIVDARILTMAGPVIESGTILVKDGVILAVAENVRIPDGAEELNARGHTVMPGLADMHVHHWSQNEGPLYIANGVTTVRNLWGTTDTIRLDQGAADGSYVGPQIFTPGPLMDGPEPIWGPTSLVIETAEQAVGAVRTQKAAGFEAIKLYEKLPADAYRAAVAEARRLNMQVYTHTPASLTVEDVVDLRVDSLEHMDGVGPAIVRDGVDLPGDKGPGAYYQNLLARWGNADEDKMAALAANFAANDVASSVTLSVTINRLRHMGNPERFWRSDEAAYVPAETRAWWDDSAAAAGPALSADALRDARRGQLAFVKELHDAGATLLIGTDTPNPFVVQGFAMHDELDSFIEAGIPTAEVLEIATAGAADFLGEEDNFGRVTEGLRADLILVRGDPRENVRLLRKPAYVIAQGTVYSRRDLETMLDEVASAVAEGYRQN